MASVSIHYIYNLTQYPTVSIHHIYNLTQYPLCFGTPHILGEVIIVVYRNRGILSEVIHVVYRNRGYWVRL
jgi:hypothetical protein